MYYLNVFTKPRKFPSIVFSTFLGTDFVNDFSSDDDDVEDDTSEDDDCELVTLFEKKLASFGF